MRQFIGFALAFPGNQGINVLRPDVGSSGVYTVVDRFADPAARQAFKMTPEYAAWMKRLGELTDGEPQIQEIGGLGGWFTPPGLPRGMVPGRLKMACVTFLGVYPLTSLLPPFFERVTPDLHPLMRNVIVTALIVAALTWLVMPALTRLFRPWLYGNSP